jgi:hypothetical protein
MAAMAEDCNEPVRRRLIGRRPPLLVAFGAMATVGRNAPCPCGRGRKYKQCCLREEERLAKQARDDSRVGRLISDWSVEQFGDELAQAFEEFHPESHRIGERDFALLLTWFISDRALSGGGTPIACYLARPDLAPDEREVAKRIAAARLGLHRVKAVVPGGSLELEDVLTGAVVPVASQTVSREVVRWDVLLCRLMPGDLPATLWGPVLVYAPDEETEFLAEVARLAEAHGLSRDPAGLSEVFRLASRELLRFVPPSRLAEPSYFTAEGDPVVSARAMWSLLDPDDAFVVLDAPPELLWVGESDDGTGECFQLTADRKELLVRRPPLPPNALFFESSYAGFPDRIGTGTFVLAGSELRFDGISEQRLEHALELVSRRLAGNAELLDREVAPFDLDPPERRHALAPGEEDVLAVGYLEQYLRRWLDEPLERLEGTTPRAAASIPKLRAHLELLLRAIENRAEHARRAGAAWPDVAWLRDELDLTAQLAA